MASDDIPTGVRELLRSHVETYEHLEVLLLLGQDAARAWTADAVADTLRLSTQGTSDALQHLADGGLLRRSESFSDAGFSCQPDRIAAINDLADAHRRDRVGVMSLMTSNAMERVRTAALRTFATSLKAKRDN